MSNRTAGALLAAALLWPVVGLALTAEPLPKPAGVAPSSAASGPPAMLAPSAATPATAAPIAAAAPAATTPAATAADDMPAGTPPEAAPAPSAALVPITANAPAKQLFGQVATPANLAARSIGFYSRGCLAGAKALPVDGQTWQVMRLKRNRNWGHPDLIAFLERLANGAPRLGWRGLLVGDLSQPRGGPMLTGHASHQIGLDADIWLTPMPDRRLSTTEREELSAVSMLDETEGAVDPTKWTSVHARLIKRAAVDSRVERIFVHPAIKRELCRTAGGDRNWLRKVRPYWGHHYHFHVRIKCPRGSPDCHGQDPVPSGDGCGDELQQWLARTAKPVEPPPAPAKPEKPKPPVTLAALPDSCQQVLLAN